MGGHSTIMKSKLIDVYRRYSMTDSERIRAILGISRAEFSRRYHIPVRTLEQWDGGVANPPRYVLELLEKVVEADNQKSN